MVGSKTPAVTNSDQQSASLPPNSGVRPKLRRSGVLKHTAILSALSVLSPVAGLAVELALAWRFGTSPLVDAYRVSYLLLIFGQQVFVTSVLPYVVVPLFAESRAAGRPEDAWAIAESLSNLFLLMGGLVALMLFLFPGQVAAALAPGLAGAGRAHLVFLIRWCGLAYIPVGWSGVACGILYAHEVFWVAPISQFLTNAMLLFAIVTFGSRFGAVGVATGVLAGAAACAWLYATTVIRERRRYSIPRTAGFIRFSSLYKVARLAGPLVAGTLVAQLSGVVTARALSRLPAGTLAAFGYGSKLGMLVLLTPSALSTVLFPRFSEDWHSKTVEAFTAGCASAVRATLYIALPLTCIAYALRGPIVALLLQHGAFTPSAKDATAKLFGILILSTPAAAASSVLYRMFYAGLETSLPAVVNIASALLMMSLIPMLAAKVGAPGVAVVFTLVPWLTCGVLMACFWNRQRSFPVSATVRYSVVAALIALASSWLGAKVAAISTSTLSQGMLASAVTGVSGLLLALTFFYSATLLFGFSEAIACRMRLRSYTSLLWPPSGS